MTARIVAVFIALIPVGALLDGTEGVANVLWVGGFLAVLTLLVRGIDRLDKWGRRTQPGWIVLPEYEDPVVIDLASRRAS